MIHRQWRTRMLRLLVRIQQDRRSVHSRNLGHDTGEGAKVCAEPLEALRRTSSTVFADDPGNCHFMKDSNKPVIQSTDMTRRRCRMIAIAIQYERLQATLHAELCAQRRRRTPRAEKAQNSARREDSLMGCGGFGSSAQSF